MVQGIRLAAILMRPAEQDAASTGVWWPVDRVLVAYLAATALLILPYFARIPGAFAIVALHAAGIALVVLAIRRPFPGAWVFRHWYPLPCVAACYKEMAILIPAMRGWDADEALARLDFALWGVHPTVWLECLQIPALTELLQVVYALFVPAVLLVAFLLWRQKRFRDFRYYAFLIATGFLVSYIGYLLVPARGPRFFLHSLQYSELHGLWLFHGLQAALDRLESAHYDCFPSGHTEMTVLAWWGSRALSRRWFWSYFLYTWCIVFATVYLRYHYTVDVFAGIVVACLLLAGAPRIYSFLDKKGPLFGR